MREPSLRYKKLVLVCTNEREGERECCKKKGSFSLYRELKTRMKEIDPEVRVSQSGCLGNCLSGVSVVIMPDDVWLGEVTVEDIPEIISFITK